MIQFKLRKFAGNSLAALCFFQIFAICGIDTDVNIQTFFGGNKIGVGHTDLCHNGNRLGVAAVFFSVDLGAVCLVSGNLLRKLKQIVGGTETDFTPGAVVKEAVGAVREIKEETDIGEHRDNGFAALKNIDMFLHINFHQFRTFHQCDLLHQLHTGKGEVGNSIQNGIVNFDNGTGIKSQQSTQFNTAVFVTADIIGQTFFHFNKTFDFIKGAERRNFAVIAEFIDQFITVFAVFQQIRGDFHSALGGGNLKVNAGSIQHKILFCAAGALLTQQHTVIRLLSVEKGQTEVKNAERKVNVKIVDILILTL